MRITKKTSTHIRIFCSSDEINRLILTSAGYEESKGMCSVDRDNATGDRTLIFEIVHEDEEDSKPECPYCEGTGRVRVVLTGDTKPCPDCQGEEAKE